MDLAQKQFHGHNILVPIVEAWLSRQPSNNIVIPMIAQGALLVRSPLARDILTTHTTGWGGHWASSALLEGWGMNDATVAAALTALAFGPDEQAIYHAHLFPHIILDSGTCRQRLLSLLKEIPSVIGYASVLSGLAILGDTEDDREVVDRLLPLLALGKRSIMDSTVEVLIDNYSTDPRIRTALVGLHYPVKSRLPLSCG